MWYTHNLKDRLTNPTLDFEMKLTPTKFKVMSFEEAGNYTAKKIAELGVPLYLALSGGADSEGALLCLHRNNVSVKPIIVRTEGNKEESAFAFHICRALDIVPIVIDLSNEDILALFKFSSKKLNSNGIYCIPNFVCSTLAKSNGGVLILGNHLADESMDGVWNAYMYEWDFYTNTLINPGDIDFFIHTPEIAYAMVAAMDGSDPHEFKSKLYGTTFRPKIFYKFDSVFDANVRELTPKKLPSPLADFGHRDEFLKMMDDWNV